MINRKVSHYRILSQIGEGGMACVYLADDLKHGRRVAIKVMNAGLRVGAERFQREIEIAARLTHPHILPLHDSGLIDDQPFYVMPYIEGESLRQRIAREKALGVDTALRFATEIASALGYAHEQGLIHRDIKPENVLLSNGIALVADFGIARSTTRDGDLTLTRPNSAIGTPTYMSPEQLEGTSIDCRADLYSLGCVLFEMLVGTPPFTGTVFSIAHQHRSDQPRSVTEGRSDVPDHIAHATMKLLAKKPGERFTTATEFMKAISTANIEAPTLSFETGRPRAIVATNLPQDRTRFIGRNHELIECHRLLKTTRLLTLTSLGGCGKTRLAIKVAESLAPQFSGGAWFVDLSPLTEAGHVITTVAQVLSVREEADKNLTDLVVAYLADKSILLVLDNCEHLLATCAELVDRLLNSCSQVQIVATSREALNIQGERTIPLSTLGLPDTTTDLDTVKSADAVRLFLDRAQIARAGFELTADNATSIVEVCRRLDGIPLAIELAAARVKILSINQILTKLDDRFKLLASTGRTMLPRHQTLRAVIEWSYDHLSDEEQRLLRALSVFAGGWTLHLAASVFDGADEFEVLELHSHLVDKSILGVAQEQDGSARYAFLDTVRQFLLERLNESGEALRVREAHLQTMMSMAEQSYAERISREEYWTNALEVESDNLRVALQVSRETDSETYLTLVGALAWFWIARTHLFEAREHLSAALSSSSANPPRPTRARALWGAAQTLALQGDASGARAWMDEALSTWRDLGDSREIALALEGIGWTHFFSSEDEEACKAFAECLRIQRESGDQHLIIRAMVGLAQVLVALGRTSEAKPMALEIIDFAKPRGDKRSEHFGWHYLADCELILGNCKESLDLYKQSLLLAKPLDDKVEISFEVQGVAMSLAGLGQTKLAVQLAGGVKAEWNRLGVDIHVRFWDALLDRYIGGAKEKLGNSESAQAWNQGLAIPFDDAISTALAARPL